MPISQISSFFNQVIDGISPIAEEVYAFFRERQRNRLYDFVVRGFLEKEEQLSRANLARRLNKKPEQITRWLSAPGNWTLDTVSDLVLAVYGGELSFSVTPISELPRRNSSQLALLEASTAEPIKSKMTSTGRPTAKTYVKETTYA